MHDPYAAAAPAWVTDIICDRSRPEYEAVKRWDLKSNGVISIDTIGGTAAEAATRAIRLFAKLGSLGCIQNHFTRSAA